MVWVIVFLAVVVIGIAWVAIQGRLGGMPPAIDDQPGPDLPDSKLTSADIRGLRFAVTARGYSMTQVDAVLERLAAQMDGELYHPVDAYDAWLNETDPEPPVVEEPIDEELAAEESADDAPVDGQGASPIQESAAEAPSESEQDPGAQQEGQGVTLALNSNVPEN